MPPPTTPPSPRAPGDFHPLEIIPPFRHIRPSIPRDLAYTFIWNTLLAAGFVLLAAAFGRWRMNAETAWAYFAIAQVIGYTIHGLFWAGGIAGLDAKVHARGGLAMAAYYTSVSCVGVLAGFFLAGEILDLPLRRYYTTPRIIGGIVLNSLVISSIIAAIFFAREREAKAKATLAAERLRLEQAERQATLAELKALQAQIEPHFLFNTLANATSLMETDAPRAKRLLEAFIRFLRATLASNRAGRTTLADEFAMLGDFLEVLAIRMGDRLAVRRDLPADLAAVEVPPMLLQPLVENAIRHGLEPKVEGGTLTIAARRAGTQVELEVSDTGAGFRPSPGGTGVGLANIRERLRLAHGDGARLAIRESPSGGTIATVTLPLGPA
jgi:signal transduction histidine kinase